MASLQRYFKYNESVVFNISRTGRLPRQRSSWSCPHSEECSEKYGDYREERRPQFGERHKESCAQCGLHVYAIIEFDRLKLRQCFCGRQTIVG
jgi:hypothetical protein